MSIYLPIAEIPVDIFLLLFIGMIGGILAGLFGIGGGFLITPILIFIGIPPSVAVATSANQIIASSITGLFGHWYRRTVDVKMALFLLIGGLIGSYAGILIFRALKSVGQIDLTISIIYVLFLGTIGGLMAYESYIAIFKKNKGKKTAEIKRDAFFNLGLIGGAALMLTKLKGRMSRIKMPLIMEFRRSGITISALMPFMIGIISGIMVSLMGIGGGFVMIPAMIYLLKMPSNMVVGTSLFQIIFVTSMVTIMHAVNTQSVDLLLALILIFGGVAGAQIGGRLGLRFQPAKMRLMLSIIILALCIRLAGGLLIEPNQIYTIEQVAE